ncbi:FecR family protein [Paenalcaligenes suwonensis]|uniref:FecR family protein n=1 Tax=Paenalcaligenes suwonensis TaxID=1202713 RepID=UPI00140A33AA|nr:FecR family protein [Paenalcaligenes suwonensis]NHC60944.1 FecR family protein [Paenalcaligenes suwonensis]
MHTENTNLPDTIPDAAAYWFARVHSGNLTAAERERSIAWRSEHPRHEQEYRALDQIWQATSLLPEDDLRELLEASDTEVSIPNPTRRRWIVGAGVACSAAVVGGVALYGHKLETATSVLHYATTQGEQRDVVLPDGSVVAMNVHSEITVRYYESRRVVELLRGEAAFEVVSNQGQPFIVEADAVNVRVTGTVFTVRRDPSVVTVAVQSGSVEVSAGQWWSRDRAMLGANMVASASEGKPINVTRADVAMMTAWRQGKVVFNDQPLDEVVREMNRYLQHPIRLTDSRLRALRMAGVFTIQDAEGFLQALQTHLPVVVVQRPDGSVSVSLLR